MGILSGNSKSDSDTRVRTKTVKKTKVSDDRIGATDDAIVFGRGSLSGGASQANVRIAKGAKRNVVNITGIDTAAFERSLESLTGVLSEGTAASSRAIKDAIALAGESAKTPGEAGFEQLTKLGMVAALAIGAVFVFRSG